MLTGNILLLGLGMQGRAALYDLVNNTDCTITVVDYSIELFAYLTKYPTDRVKGISVNINNLPNLNELVRESDLVVEALPSSFTLSIAKLATEENTHMVTSSYLLNPTELDKEIIENSNIEINSIHEKCFDNDKIILSEFGLDPGIDLFLGKKAIKQFDQVEVLNMYGMGIPEPQAITNALKYKFSWTTEGVMKAYIRPANIIRNSKTIHIPANEMFNPEYCHTITPESLKVKLECYPNSNSSHYAKLFGIRNQVKEMGRYAGRYPGHINFWYKIAKVGLLGNNPVTIENAEISPLKFLAAFFQQNNDYWYDEKEKDLVLIRIDAKGLSKGKHKQVIYELIDERNLETGFTAMQRTVGFNMALGARLILENKIQKPGVLSPLDVDYNLVLPHYEKHGMKLIEKIS